MHNIISDFNQKKKKTIFIRILPTGYTAQMRFLVHRMHACTPSLPTTLKFSTVLHRAEYCSHGQVTQFFEIFFAGQSTVKTLSNGQHDKASRSK